MSGIHAKHFRKVVHDTLEAMGPPYDSPAAEELLLLTAAQESRLGRWLWQAKRDGSPGGPAVGPYQFEPATHRDLWVHWISKRIVGSDLLDRIDSASWLPQGVDDWYSPMVKYSPHLLAINLAYATVICRLNYWRKPQALPAADDVEGLAAYWHKWHCAGCKGKPENAIRNYRSLVLRGQTR